jgi:hypothetical protein
MKGVFFGAMRSAVVIVAVVFFYCSSLPASGRMGCYDSFVRLGKPVILNSADGSEPFKNPENHQTALEILNEFDLLIGEGPVEAEISSAYLLPRSYGSEGDVARAKVTARTRLAIVQEALGSLPEEAAFARGERDPKRIAEVSTDLSTMVSPREQIKTGGFVCALLGGLGAGLAYCSGHPLIALMIALPTSVGTGSAYAMAARLRNFNSDYGYLARSLDFFSAVKSEIKTYERTGKASKTYPQGQLLWNHIEAEVGSLHFGFGYPKDKPAFVGAFISHGDPPVK